MRMVLTSPTKTTSGGLSFGKGSLKLSRQLGLLLDANLMAQWGETCNTKLLPKDVLHASC